MGFWQKPPFLLLTFHRNLLKLAFFRIHGRYSFFFISFSQNASPQNQHGVYIFRSHEQSKFFHCRPLPLSRLLQYPPDRHLRHNILQNPPILPFSFFNPFFPQSQLLILNYSSSPGEKSPQISRVSTDYPHRKSESGIDQVCNVDDPREDEIEMICKCLDKIPASGGDVDSRLDRCGVILCDDLVYRVLKRFSSEWKPALHFFNWTKKSGCDYTHGSVVYNKMMEILAGRSQYETMAIFLHEMGEKGLLTIDTFTISFKAFASAKQRKKAIACFDIMKKYGFNAGVDTMNCLLECLVDEKQVKEAQILFEILKARTPPNMTTYSILLSGWCRGKNLSELVKKWNEIADAGFDPGIAIHNTMLEGLVKCHKRSDAMKLFFIMKAKGPNPNLTTYTVLIKYLCKHRGMNEAVELVHEMVDSGCYPDAVIYTCLIIGYAKEKKIHMVCKLLKEMMEKVNCLEVKPYNSMIILMVNLEMWDEAMKVYEKMVENGVRPNTQTYNRMMRMHFQKRDCERGCSVWEELKRSECKVDRNSYTAFIGGLIRNGRAEEACGYLEEMLVKGMEPPHVDYNRFAADFFKAGRPNILDELAQKMLFSANYVASNFFARWAVMMKRRIGPRKLLNSKVRDINCS